MNQKDKRKETQELLAWHIRHIRESRFSRNPEVHHQHFCSFHEEEREDVQTRSKKEQGLR